jgi:AraC-like DNA-binding protein
MLRFTWRSLGELGADRRLLARGAGLPVWGLGDDSARLDLNHLVKLWQLGSAICGRDVGIEAARAWSRGSLSLADYLLVTAPTLAAGMRLMVSYRHLLVHNPANELELLDHADGLELRCRVHSGDEQVNAVASEFCVSLMLWITRRTLDRMVMPICVGLSGPPRTGRQRLRLRETLETRHIECHAERASITFARRDAEAPLPNAEPALATILRNHAETLTRDHRAGRTWLDEFRALLVSRLPEPTATLPSMARAFAMSSRTLQRRLSEANTSWHAELDRARHQTAVRLLQDGASRKEIAARLGYSDARSLRRTLQRWSRD